MLNSHTKKSFTLAEVLITLALIGAVAAMSVPNLISNVEDAKHTKLLRKFHADLSGAITKLQAPGSDVTFDYSSTNHLTTATSLRDALCQVMFCKKKDTVINIWGSSINPLDGENTVYKNYKSDYKIYTDAGLDYPAAELENGALIAINFYNINRYSYQFYVDTNGAKGPNMFGMDVHMFEIDNETGYFRVLPEGAKSTYDEYPTKYCRKNYEGHGGNWPCTFQRLYHPETLP